MEEDIREIKKTVEKMEKKPGCCWYGCVICIGLIIASVVIPFLMILLFG